ncbi:Signal transduction histidine kinase [Ohtaekwangia koreensis]|uniref:histidine kinase n=2 Tax=Ohtaekwangia koreensis TaxID=688867 RepID=A0A1T5LS17_9BACT|nr:Signal transduction histidine kinase [Ohtaekwangia koreensis]
MNISIAQDTLQVDSMLKVIPTTPQERLDGIFDKMEKILANEPTGRALNLAFQALSTVKNNKMPVGEVLAYRNIAQIYDRIGNREEALRYYGEALNVAKDNSDNAFASALAHLNMGQFLSEQELRAGGLQHILDAAKLFENLNMFNYVVLCHYQGCMINYDAHNYRQCIEEGYRVLSYHDKMMLGEITDQTKFQKMSIYNTIALANYKLKQYDIAIINYEKAEALAKEINDEFWIGLINGNKAVVLKNLGQTQEAIKSIVADYRTSKKFKVWGSAGVAATELCQIYLSINDIEMATRYLDSAKAVFAQEADKVNRRKAMANYYYTYSKLKSATGHFPAAYKALAHHVQLRDSLYQEQESLNLAKVKASYDLDQKQTEIELLTKNNEIQQERIRSQRTIFIATLVGLILLVILVINLIYNYRRQKNIAQLIQLQHNEIEAKNVELETQSTQLQENNQYIQLLNAQLEQKVEERTHELEVTNNELDTFLYRSSHDMRRPITTLLGLDQVARYAINDPQSIVLFDKVVDTARSMDSMLFKMQMMYELNKANLPISPVNLHRVIEESLKYFKADFTKYNIVCHFSPSQDIVILSNAALLQIIFRNLIENSVLFRKTQAGATPFVDVNVAKTNDSIQISIADNGIGVEEKYQSQLFDLYFRASQASKGNGLGLYLVKKAVTKLKGEIELISDYGIGTTITIKLRIVQ